MPHQVLSNSVIGVVFSQKQDPMIGDDSAVVYGKAPGFCLFYSVSLI